MVPLAFIQGTWFYHTGSDRVGFAWKGAHLLEPTQGAQAGIIVGPTSTVTTMLEPTDDFWARLK